MPTLSVLVWGFKNGVIILIKSGKSYFGDGVDHNFAFLSVNNSTGSRSAHFTRHISYIRQKVGYYWHFTYVDTIQQYNNTMWPTV